MSEQVVNPYKEVTVDEVYDGMISINYLEKTHKDMTTQLKNTKPYKALMQMAERNFCNSNYNAPIQDVQQSTREKIKEVGSLALDFDYSISNILSKTVNLEAKCVIETFIKRVSNLKQIDDTEHSPSSKKRMKRPASNTPKKSQVHDSDVKLFKKSNSETDSSVHTSDLSSLEDEVVIPNEDQAKDKKPKIISFKAVNQAYKSMVSKRKNIPKHKKNIQKSSKMASNESNSHESLPKRIRKPNSKYTSMDD